MGRLLVEQSMLPCKTVKAKSAKDLFSRTIPIPCLGLASRMTQILGIRSNMHSNHDIGVSLRYMARHRHMQLGKVNQVFEYGPMVRICE